MALISCFGIIALFCKIACIWCLFCGSTLVYEIGNAHIGDAAVGLEANFAGAAVGIAYLNLVFFYLALQFPQSPLVGFGMRPAAVSGKAATAHALGKEHVVGTESGELDEGIAEAHLAGGTSEVDSYTAVDGMEVEMLAQERHDEFRRLVEFHLRNAFTHTM